MNEQNEDTGSSSILIIDDNTENLRLLAGLLIQEGYNIRTIRHGSLVLDSIKNSKPDLILLDIVMPDIDGYEICGQLKSLESTRDIPVIFISALNEYIDRLKAFSSGGVDYISKPFHPEEFIARIRQQITFANHRKELVKAKTELERADLYKKEFLADLNHEIRTPLNAVLGLTQLALETELSSKQQDYLSKIRAASNTLLNIADNAFDISNNEAEHEQITNAEIYEKLSQIRGASVLLVEDNMINQQVAAELLKNKGLNVTIAHNGRQALEKLENMRFDIVLMDIRMPEMNGIEAVKAIRNLPVFDNLPVIAMTAHTLDGDKERFMDSGMNGYLSKPIKHEQLFTTLVKWIKPGIRKPADTLPGNDETDLTGFPQELPGLDINAGLRNVSGNKKMFRKIILQFAEKFGNTAKQMEDILENGEVEKGEHLIHNLKGVSGNIGASDLFSLTESFENALKYCASDNFTGLTKKLEKEIRQVLKSAAVLKDLKPKKNRRKKTGNNLNPDILKSNLNELLKLLNDSDLVEEELLNLIFNCLDNSQSKKIFKEMESFIEVYDYENAVKSLKILADSLSMSLDIGGKYE